MGQPEPDLTYTQALLQLSQDLSRIERKVDDLHNGDRIDALEDTVSEAVNELKGELKSVVSLVKATKETVDKLPCEQRLSVLNEHTVSIALLKQLQGLHGQNWSRVVAIVLSIISTLVTTGIGIMVARMFAQTNGGN